MNKIFSKLGIAISITLLYVIVSVVAFKLNIVSFDKGKKEYPVCGTGKCEATVKNGSTFCYCDGKVGRAKNECCTTTQAAPDAQKVETQTTK